MHWVVNYIVNLYNEGMAKKVNLEELTAKPRGVRPKYPWTEWTDGDWWIAERGQDYTVADKTFRSTLANHAFKKGLWVTTRETDNGMAFQFRPREAAK